MLRSLCVILLLVMGFVLLTPAFALQTLGKGKIYIRFTNIRPDGAKVLVRMNVVPNHYQLIPPDETQELGWAGKTVYVGKDGMGDKTDAARYLSPGEMSPWVDVGQYMNPQGTRSWDTYLSPVLCAEMTDPQTNGLFLIAEVAQGPGTDVIRRVEVKKPELSATSRERVYPWILGYATWNSNPPFLPTLGLLVPTHPDINPRIYTLEEAVNDQLDVIAEFPDTGRAPTQIVFKTSDHPEVMKAIGYNGYPEGTIEGNLGDEIGLSINMPEDKQNQAFREFLKARGIDPLDVLLPEDAAKAKGLTKDQQWAMVTLPKMGDKPEESPVLQKPVLYYEQADFRYQIWYQELAAQTKDIEAKNPGKKVIVGANYSPHMNVWPDVRQWVDPFKAGAMTMSWTEDWWWQLPECSPQVYGFLLDGLRLGDSYHNIPMQYYIMPFRGQSEDNLRRMHSLAFAHGAKIINHFVTQSQAMITWDYVDQTESPRTYQAIHDMIRDAGAVENRLYPALPQKAEVAILLSRAADTWDNTTQGGIGGYGSQYNVNNDERKSLWMALRHAQYPVDLITDEDVAEGKLAGYKVLYVVGSEMLAAAAKPLADWVRAGGIVFADGGGGLLDEFHRDNTALYDVYGLKSHNLNRAVRHIRPRGSLPRMDPLDIVTAKVPEAGLTSVTLPALCYRDALTPAAGTKVLATYQADGSPAITYHALGKGGAYYVGALAGLAYLTPAMPPSSDVLPTNFPAALRALITLPIQQARVTPPVATSNSLVEAQYMTGPKGAIVTLDNWTEKPIDRLIVRFPGVPVKSVQSLRAAGYFTGSLDEQAKGMLPITVVDGVPQVEMRLEVTDYLIVN